MSRSMTTTHAPDLLTLANDSTFENMSVVCRLEESHDAIIRPVAELPNAKELRKSLGEGLAGFLAKAGWKPHSRSPRTVTTQMEMGNERADHPRRLP